MQFNEVSRLLESSLSPGTSVGWSWMSFMFSYMQEIQQVFPKAVTQITLVNRLHWRSVGKVEFGNIIELAFSTKTKQNKKNNKCKRKKNPAET